MKWQQGHRSLSLVFSQKKKRIFLFPHYLNRTSFRSFSIDKSAHGVPETTVLYLTSPKHILFQALLSMLFTSDSSNPHNSQVPLSPSHRWGGWSTERSTSRPRSHSCNWQSRGWVPRSWAPEFMALSILCRLPVTNGGSTSFFLFLRKRGKSWEKI